MARTAEQVKVRELQRTLYRAAKADPGRRFHALYDKVYRRDVLERAFDEVARNGGAAGVDGQTIDEIRQGGVEVFLSVLEAELREGRYRPLPVQKLHLVGFTTDHEGLILSTRRGARSGSYRVVVDEELATAVEEARARQLE